MTFQTNYLFFYQLSIIFFAFLFTINLFDPIKNIQNCVNYLYTLSFITIIYNIIVLYNNVETQYELFYHLFLIFFYSFLFVYIYFKDMFHINNEYYNFKIEFKNDIDDDDSFDKSDSYDSDNNDSCSNNSNESNVNECIKNESCSNSSNEIYDNINLKENNDNKINLKIKFKLNMTDVKGINEFNELREKITNDLIDIINKYENYIEENNKINKLDDACINELRPLIDCDENNFRKIIKVINKYL